MARKYDIYVTVSYMILWILSLESHHFYVSCPSVMFYSMLIRVLIHAKLR